MAILCEALETILKDCSSAIGGLDTEMYINDSSNVDWEARTMNLTDDTIATLTLEALTPKFTVIQFRKNLASLNEDYAKSDDGAVVYTQTLSLPIHGRDAAKSRKISAMAAGQREVDIIVRQNDGSYVYLRNMQLSTVADGTGAARTDGSKYTLTFDGVSEALSFYIESTAVASLLV